MNKEVFLKNLDGISDAYMMKAKNTGDVDLDYLIPHCYSGIFSINCSDVFCDIPDILLSLSSLSLSSLSLSSLRLETYESLLSKTSG